MSYFSSDKKSGVFEYVKYLEERVHQLESEVEFLRRELNYYKGEIDKLMASPLVEAVLLELLEDGRAIVRSSAGPTLVVNISGSVDTSRLKPGVHVALNQRGSTVVEVLPIVEDYYVKAMEVDERPRTTFKDVGGLHEQIREIREVVELPLKSPELFSKIGIEPPKGVLLYGPPGCGKTLLARAVAGEVKATFIRLAASELAQKFVGEGARIVREVFRSARRKAPAIVFIDELDAIGAKRLDIGTSGEREIHRTLSQLLVEIDGFDPLDKVKIMAATNRIDVVDPALLRPGRFDRLVEVPPPDLAGRYEILKIYTSKMSLDSDVDLMKLASMTEGLCGADIKAICVEAGYSAIRRNASSVSMSDFIQAIGRYVPRKSAGSRRDAASLTTNL
ncbi:MAG: proteasome-activating nucleotidase [Sulfolobales archaeon]|nr:proteasome-activating nucleotidase [Sulfolobales archaeon]MCX8209018.1 proteasome-activating nucleotidase [Sulfolobales archaeon]MDW8011282.1 proteasome-activating nucleotidase [Sulfolobales archaeon]